MTVFLISILTFVFTLLGGFFALRFKDKLHLILGFSAGAVLGVALLDLLSESIEIITKSYSIETAALLVVVGFCLFMIFDRLFSIHFHDEAQCHNEAHQGQLGATALIIHSFLDGFGIGLAFQISTAVGWIVAAAVLAHDFSDGINTVSMILKNEGKSKVALKWLLADAIAPTLGAASTIFFSVRESTLGIILSLFTGFFLYIGASDLIPESHHRHPAIWTSLTTILGIIVIYGAIRFASN